MQWSITGEARSGELFVKKHEERWSAADVFPVDMEPLSGRAGVRFALATGHWDIALVIPRVAPLLRFDLVGDGTGKTLTPQASTPAGRVTGRIKEARTGNVPRHWRAYVRDINADLDPATQAFFEQRPVAIDGRVFDYSSLPAGSWEVLVEAAGHGRRRATFSISPPFVPVDLGDMFLTAGGNLKVDVSFPSELPRGAVLVSLYRDRPGSLLGKPELLASQTLRLAPQASVDFTDLEPGMLRLVCESAIDGLYRQEQAIIVAGKVLTIPLSFIPTTIEGEVWRGRMPIESVTVTLERDRHRVAGVSDSEGRYAIRVWSAGDYLCTAQPANGGIFPQVVIVPPETATVSHDIALPPNVVIGIVRDADTGAPIPSARIRYQNTEQVSGRTAVNFYYTRYAGSDGAYRLDNLEARSVDLHVTADGYAPADSLGVMPNEDGASVDIALSRAGILRGSVFDESGAGVAGAFVGLDPAGADFRMQATTARTGEFEFRDVANGSHILVVYKCGYRLEVQTVASTNDPQALTLLHATGGVTLHFEDVHGNPLARVGVSLATKGITLPPEYPARFALQCGIRVFSDGEGNLSYDFLPEGPISLFAEPHHEFLGTYINDGVQRVWRISFPTPSGSK